VALVNGYNTYLGITDKNCVNHLRALCNFFSTSVAPPLLRTLLSFKYLLRIHIPVTEILHMDIFSHTNVNVF
jgi:hypothetical protein